jgi:hypothetical protein
MTSLRLENEVKTEVRVVGPSVMNLHGYVLMALRNCGNHGDDAQLVV